jgi:hypothetical protein
MDTQAAFEILIGQLQKALRNIQKKGVQAFEQNEYSTAQKIAQHAEVIRAKLKELENLRENWDHILNDVAPQKTKSSSKKRKHLSPGLKTPENAFRIPILKALEKLGGSGATQEVVDVVGTIMDNELNEYDRELLQDSRTQRWRNSAQWERATMVEEGLLKDSSPRGIWEISNEGRVYLEEKNLEKRSL